MYCLIALDNVRVLITTDLGYVWGKNYYRAAEFQSEEEVKQLVPPKLLSEFRWLLIPYEEELKEQKKAARRLRLEFEEDLSVEHLRLPDVYTETYYSTKDVATVLGIIDSHIGGVYNKLVGEPIPEDPSMNLYNPKQKSRGRKRLVYSTKQVDMIFNIRLKSPKINKSKTMEMYENWLLTVN